MKSKASAPGKVILFGEHFVVYGIKAILCSINKRVTVTAESAGSVKVVRCWKEQYQKRAHTGAFTCDVAITLFEGKHHQIRRLCHRSKLKVKHLHRVSICGVLHIDSVPQSGQFRWLQVDEVEQLRNKFGLCNHDSKYPQCLNKDENA